MGTTFRSHWAKHFLTLFELIVHIQLLEFVKSERKLTPNHQVLGQHQGQGFNGFPAFPTFPTFPKPQPFIENNPFRSMKPFTLLNGELMKFAMEALLAHNKYRGLHGVPPLVLDDQLSIGALEWAKKLAADCDSSKHCLLTHRKKEDRGENIFGMKGPNTILGSLPVDIWYNEIKFYNFSNPGIQGKAGHFSQVIWKGSKKMGIAWAKGKEGSIICVANYQPRGNYASKAAFVTHVPPPII